VIEAPNCAGKWRLRAIASGLTWITATLTNSADFEKLAELLEAANRQAEAVNVLRQGMQADPNNAELYRHSSKIYFALNQTQEACEVAAKGRQKFPQDDAVRALMNRCANALAGMSK
jgi:tetratricopeptide (TPR) repeat protein